MAFRRRGGSHRGRGRHHSRRHGSGRHRKTRNARSVMGRPLRVGVRM